MARQAHRGSRRCAAAATPIVAAPSAASTDATFEDFVDYIQQLQSSILSGAEQLDGSGAKFVRDQWQRDPSDANAGWGATCVLEGGRVLEKAAANTTVVRGTLTAARAQAMSSRGRAEIDPKGGQPYAAAAMSLVFHSAHPLVPTLRADVRLFQVAGQSWFGGGCDLTPFYVNEDDARAFHAKWKQVCDKHQEGLYPKLKEWCDKYFYIPCRHEHRGLGGIFYDDMSTKECGFDAAAFTRDVGDAILPSWHNIAATRSQLPFTQQQRDWQLIRRGRYLEFNLLYDRGVKFGLDGGRIESIMVSAPPLIAWKYNVVPQPGSQEERLVQVLRKPQQWA
eukprot:CAMPEP_0202880098 /NCGR_PEP_ID=MMETSP1391-20130828/34571_1 /ASSEMBLY_ACC=CAM_ASM_000867 /TAXON_ID=1034604 /ORGANISM="Chlamydomonas leiostraca, Strain SAG 11-49" /LENGTH=335 /DNA_ID=CAMNT_0049562549 /DNA_START=258 /DNA_END=1265 /DNA_ORIENTATION=-